MIVVPSQGYSFLPEVIIYYPVSYLMIKITLRYLALDEIYHLLWAAIPNNPTHQSFNTFKTRTKFQSPTDLNQPAVVILNWQPLSK
jgi:hypothetical protein